MDTATFLLELQRRAKSADWSPDPLSKAMDLLGRIATTGEGQALWRVLEALATKTGEFRESDVYLFGSDTLPLVAALINARMDGRYR